MIGASREITSRPNPMGGGKGGGIGSQISDKGNEISQLETQVKDTADNVTSTLGTNNTPGSINWGEPNTNLPGNSMNMNGGK